MTGSQDPPLIPIDFAKNEVYECAATLLAVLAAPQDDERRGELHASLCARALRAAYLANPDDVTPILVKPQYAFRCVKLVDRDLDFVARRMFDRTNAARMAIAFLREVELGRPVPLPAGIRRLSINELAAFIAEDAGQSEVANVKSRIWRPSLPVIHLAVAAAFVGQVIERHGAAGGIDILLWSRDRVTSIVEYAEYLETLVTKCDKISVGPAGLVKIRLV